MADTAGSAVSAVESSEVAEVAGIAEGQEPPVESEVAGFAEEPEEPEPPVESEVASVDSCEDEDEYGDETKDDDEDDKYKEGEELPRDAYGENTPSKKRRMRKPGSVWTTIKRLKLPLPAGVDDKNTHVCVRRDCWRLLKIGYDKKQCCWVSTKALDHNRMFHPGVSAPADKSLEGAAARKKKKQRVMFGSFGNNDEFKQQHAVNNRDAALGAAARTYIYGRGRISKESFDDPVIRERDQAMYQAGGGKGKAPLLTKEGFVEWVHAEYEVFKLLLNHMMLDPRTIGLVKSKDRTASLGLLRQSYISFAKKANKCDAEAMAPAPTPAPARPMTMAGASWSDDDDDDDNDNDDGLTSPPAVDYDAVYGSEFDRVYHTYRKKTERLEYGVLFPAMKLPEGYGPSDLLEADIGVVFDSFIKEDPDRAKYGYLPLMATHSRASVGSLLASSFPERINSAADLILTKGNTLLDGDEIKMCMVLRMNRKFMQHMREHSPDTAQQHFKKTHIFESTPP